MSLQKALAAAARGWLVHPVGEDKRPLTRWSETATTDERAIRRMWQQFPDALVGVVTGAKSDLYVVDVDKPERAAELGLPLAFGVPMPTRREGGCHYLFGGPADGKRVPNKTDNGVDHRGDGGFIVLWGDVPTQTLSSLPAEGAQWARGGRSEDGKALDPGGPIADGGRNSALASRAGVLRRQGFSEDAILAALRVTNIERCVPPLDDEEVEAIAASVARYEPDEAVSGGEKIRLALLSAQSAAEPESPRPTRLKTAADRAGRPAPVWAVEQLIPEYGVGQMYGDSYVGKTFVALGLAMSIANESVSDWYGHRINRHGPVVYVAMEGSFDFGQRVDAWLLAHDGASPELLFTLEEEAVDLASEESLALLRDDIRQVGIDPALMVIDTQSLATPGTDENSNPDMSLVFSNLKRLAVELRCPIFTVHHTGLANSNRARGASAVRAALDFEVRVTKGQIEMTKIKAAALPLPWTFHLAESGESVWAAPGTSVSQMAEAHVGNYAKIGEVIRKNPFELSRNGVVDRAGVNRQETLRVIKGMIEDGDVIEGPGGKLAWKDAVDSAST